MKAKAKPKNWLQSMAVEIDKDDKKAAAQARLNRAAVALVKDFLDREDTFDAEKKLARVVRAFEKAGER